jgi:PGF-CTERM protein
VKLTKSGYTDFSAPATVAAGKTTPVSATLQQGTSPTGTGTITVTSDPTGAGVNLDGWQKGTTPTSIQNVKAGSHTIILSKAGYADFIGTANVVADKTTTVIASLKTVSDTTPEGTGKITVSSNPVGANVYLDGQSQGTTPLTLQSVPAGPHNVLLTMSKYKEVPRSVQVTAGSDSQIVVDMAKDTPGFGVVLAIAALGILLVVSRRKK